MDQHFSGGAVEAERRFYRAPRPIRRRMISRTAQYALRALATIAEKGEGSSLLASEISQLAHIPHPYLSSILRTAVRAGLLRSARGRGGGFSLMRPADEVSLAEILGPFDPSLAARQCPFGLDCCPDASSCPVIDYWKPISADFRRMLKSTTLSELVSGSAVWRHEGALAPEKAAGTKSRRHTPG